MTIKKFYRPSGASTQLKGVVPNIVLPSVWNDSKDLGESSLENPMPWDTIPSAKFDALNLVAPYLPELRKRSDERVAADKEFSYVREDIALYKKQQADKTLSLNETQRLKEKNEADARQKARDKERLTRKEPQQKVYELTLKEASLPGLPPPVQKTNTTLAKVSGGKPAASGTNAPGATNVAAAENPDETADEEKPPAFDEPLAETESILVDYLSVLPKGNLVTVSH